MPGTRIGPGTLTGRCLRHKCSTESDKNAEDSGNGSIMYHGISGMSVDIRASDTKTHLTMAKSQLGKWTSIVDSEPQQRHQKINPLVEAEEV